MKVLVTGGYGFLGSSVLQEFSSLSHYDVSSFRSSECNLLNFDNTLKFIENKCPDAVIHLAANVGGIGKNQAMPGTMVYENLVMGLNIIESCRLLKIKKLLITGTICSYPKITPIPFNEKYIWDGYPEDTNAPYGIAKKTIMITGQSYAKQYGMNIIHLLVVNLYGPNDHFDLKNSHVIPAMIRKFDDAKRNGEKVVEMWGDGSATREFLYVKDAAQAIRLSLEKYDSCEPMNIGSGKEITIKDIANKLKDIVEYKGELIWNKNMPNGQPRRVLDVSKSEKILGWKYSTELDYGLKETYKWYIQNYH